MLALYDVVKLKQETVVHDLLSEDCDELKLPAGTLGTIVMIHDQPALPLAYEVEFWDREKGIAAVETLLASEVEPA